MIVIVRGELGKRTGIITVTTTDACELPPKVEEMLSKLTSTGLYGKNEVETLEIVVKRWLWDNRATIETL